MPLITQIVEPAIKKAYNSLSFKEKTALLEFSEQIPSIIQRYPVLQWLWQSHWTDQELDAVGYYMLWRIIDACDNGKFFATIFLQRIGLMETKKCVKIALICFLAMIGLLVMFGLIILAMMQS